MANISQSPFLALLLFAALLVAPNGGTVPVDSVHDRTCTTGECHPPTQHTAGTITHPPFLEQWCDRCHTDHSGNTKFLLRAEPDSLCLECHSQIETHQGTVLHPPAAGSCIECHEPHQSTVRHLLREEEMLGDCARCHAEDLRKASQMPFQHQFFTGASECASCHYAHQKGDGAYLRENVGETCLTCHDMSIASSRRRLPSIGGEISQLTHVHEPLLDDACHACHTPHGSMQPSLLSDNYPAGNYAGYERSNYSLCFSCHEPSIVEAEQTREATGFRDGETNLHSVHVLKSKRGRACHLCHTAHASERPHLLRETVTFGSWESDFHFNVTPEGGTCTTACHKTESYSRSAD